MERWTEQVRGIDPVLGDEASSGSAGGPAGAGAGRLQLASRPSQPDFLDQYVIYPLLLGKIGMRVAPSHAQRSVPLRPAGPARVP
jgi:hypothetical protein